MSTQRIGFIGTGVMGSGMIRNLQKAGYPVNITTRTKAKAEELIQEGCHWFDSQAELAAQSDVVISMVGLSPRRGIRLFRGTRRLSR